MLIETVEAKLEFYKTILSSRKEAYVGYKVDDKETVLYIAKSQQDGFYELPCVLFGYTYDRRSAKMMEFIKEQGLVCKGKLAYEIQTPLIQHGYEKYLGEFRELTKEEAVDILLVEEGTNG